MSALSPGSQQSDSDYRTCGKQVHQWAAQEHLFLVDEETLLGTRVSLVRVF